MFAFFIVMGLVWMCVGASVAQKKGRNVVLWGALGFLFGLFAVVPLAFLPSRIERLTMV